MCHAGGHVRQAAPPSLHAHVCPPCPPCPHADRGLARTTPTWPLPATTWRSSTACAASSTWQSRCTSRCGWPPLLLSAVLTGLPEQRPGGMVLAPPCVPCTSAGKLQAACIRPPLLPPFEPRICRLTPASCVTRDPCLPRSHLLAAAVAGRRLQALEVLTRAYGLHDARVAFALHNLGGFYLSRRQLAQAADCYEQALKMKLEVLGTGHRCAPAAHCAGPACCAGPSPRHPLTPACACLEACVAQRGTRGRCARALPPS